MVSGKSRSSRVQIPKTGPSPLKRCFKPLDDLVKNHLDIFRIPLDPLGLMFLVFVLDWDADELLNVEEM